MKEDKEVRKVIKETIEKVLRQYEVKFEDNPFWLKSKG